MFRITAQRFSKQRQAIIESLVHRTDHPTAEMLYQSLRTQHPGISLGTVYRNLSLLEEQGTVLRIPMTGGPDRFDGNIAEHHHLQCEHCGVIVDLPAAPLVDMQKAQRHAAQFGAEVTDVRLIFTGRCGECANRKM